MHRVWDLAVGFLSTVSASGVFLDSLGLDHFLCIPSLIVIPRRVSPEFELLAGCFTACGNASLIAPIVLLLSSLSAKNTC